MSEQQRNGAGAPRNGPGAAIARRPAQTVQTAMAPRTQAGSRLFHDPGSLVDALRAATASANVLAPYVTVDHVPPFHGVSVRQVWIDPDKDHGEVYPLKGGGGKLALLGVGLEKISRAAGVNWLPTRWLDDRKDPNYAHASVVGFYRDFDGSYRTIVAEKVLDMRDGSAECEQIRRAAAQGSGGRDRDPMDQILQVRAHIRSHTETKARYRALRKGFAIKQGYTIDELKRPFVIPTLVFDGHTNDPALAREIAREMLRMGQTGVRDMFSTLSASQRDMDRVVPTPPTIAASAPTIGGRGVGASDGFIEDDLSDPDPRSAFGGGFGGVPVEVMPPDARSDGACDPPPSDEEMAMAAEGGGAAPDDQGYEEEDEDEIDGPLGDEPESTPPPIDFSPPPGVAASQASAGNGGSRRGGGAGGNGGLVFPPYGRAKGQAIQGATMGDLEFYRNGCLRTLADPTKANWHDKERKLLAAIEAEIARQRGGAPA